MNPANAIRFALRDRIDNVEIGPGHVPLALLGQFQDEVAEFLRGSSKDVDTNEVIVSVEDGSFALVASGLMLASSLWADVSHLQHSGPLDAIDPRRASIVEGWQRAARKHPHRSYSLADKSGQLTLRIDSYSDFRSQVEAMWVPVEKYLEGQVTDLGGTSKANVHLKLLDGKVVKIGSSQEMLAAEEKNRLYKPAVLHVGAEENLRTGELRNLHLLGFQSLPSAWNEAAFNSMTEKGTRAWKDVPDGWLEALRSNKE
jgi:hypothetical protein